MTPVEILQNSKALISSEDTWTKRALARNQDGCPVDLTSDQACAWCATGALGHVAILSGDQDAESRTLAEHYLISSVPSERSTMSKRLLFYNDTKSTTHADVMALFDRAIALAKANETA